MATRTPVSRQLHDNAGSYQSRSQDPPPSHENEKNLALQRCVTGNSLKVGQRRHTANLNLNLKLSNLNYIVPCSASVEIMCIIYVLYFGCVSLPEARRVNLFVSCPQCSYSQLDSSPAACLYVTAPPSLPLSPGNYQTEVLV